MAEGELKRKANTLGATLLNMEENSRKDIRQTRKTLQDTITKEFKDLLSVDEKLEQDPLPLDKFQQLLHDPRLEELRELVDQMKTWDVLTTIPEPKSFLYYSRLQLILTEMLNSITRYENYLKLFIARFHADNELVPTKQTSNQKNETQLGSGKSDAPIHFAATQLHEGFLEWLLTRPDTNVNLRNSFKETALAILCEKYEECMRNVKQPTELPQQLAIIRMLVGRLLQAGADFNICSSRLKLPIELLLKHSVIDNEMKHFVQQCIQQTEYALVVCKTVGNERLVGFLNNNPNVRLTEELFEIFLRYGDIGNFNSFWPQFSVTKDNVKKVIRLLLHTSLDQKLPECARLVVEKGGKFIFNLVNRAQKRGRAKNVCDTEHQQTSINELEHRVELKGLLKKACLMADIGILQLLVSKITDLILLNEDSLLALTLAKAHDAKRRSEERNALLLCAEYLANQQTIYMSKVDNAGNTPLHLALKYGFDSVALTLLKQRYAYLGLRNRDNLTPLDYGTYEFWKSYLDRCIEVETDRGNDQKVLRFNLNCFEPFHHGKAALPATNKSIANTGNWRFVQHATNVNRRPHRYVRTTTEMTTVRQIAQSKELKALLIHPVVHTFIMVKWMRLNHWNYLNLLLTVMTAAIFGSFSLTACSVDGSPPVLFVSSAIVAVLVAGRELMQMLFLRKSYFSFENTLDIVNVVVMLFILVHGCNGLLSSFLVISLAMQVTFLLGSLPFNSLSTMMYMFKTVSKNFLKSFLLFIPLIGAFIYAFYLTSNESPEEVAARDACDDDDCAEKSFNSFHTFWNATIKTLVMTTGELDASTFDFGEGKLFLFLVFVFVAPIVILNLINGLAVSDIAAIREESELISVSKKVMLLEQYERGVANVRPVWIRNFFPKPFFAEHSCWIHVKAKEFRKIEVHYREPVGPVVNNAFCANHRKTKPVLVPLSIFPWLGNNCADVFLNFRLFKLTLFMRLDQSILNEALAIIEKLHPFVANEPVSSTVVATPMVKRMEEPQRTPSSVVTPIAMSRMNAFARDHTHIELKELKAQVALLLELLQGKKKITKQRINEKKQRRKARKRLRLRLKSSYREFETDD